MKTRDRSWCQATIGNWFCESDASDAEVCTSERVSGCGDVMGSLHGNKCRHFGICLNNTMAQSLDGSTCQNWILPLSSQITASLCDPHSQPIFNSHKMTVLRLKKSNVILTCVQLGVTFNVTSWPFLTWLMLVCVGVVRKHRQTCLKSDSCSH